MDIGHPGLRDLFDQLGLPSTEEGIEAFISRNRQSSLGCQLAEAPVWTEVQAAFLREAIAVDADWAQPAEWLTNALCARQL